MENLSVRLYSREALEILNANWPKARVLFEEEQGKYDEAVKAFNSKKARDNLNVNSNFRNSLKIMH